MSLFRQGWRGTIGTIFLVVETIRIVAELWPVKSAAGALNLWQIYEFTRDRLWSSALVVRMLEIVSHPLVHIAILIAGIFLITWDNRRGKSQTIEPPKAASTTPDIAEPPNFREAQVLFHSALLPASESLKSVVQRILQKGLRYHPLPEVQELTKYVRRAAVEPEETVFGSITRMVQGVEKVDALEVQNRIGWYWNQYRLQRVFVLNSRRIVKNPEFWRGIGQMLQTWLSYDARFIELLRRFSAQPENQSLREAMKSNGWDDDVTRALHEIK